MSTENSVPSAVAQTLGQRYLGGFGGFSGFDWIPTIEQPPPEPQTSCVYRMSRMVASAVVCEALLGREACLTNVHTRWVRSLTIVSRQFDHVDVKMLGRVDHARVNTAAVFASAPSWRSGQCRLTGFNHRSPRHAHQQFEPGSSTTSD